MKRMFLGGKKPLFINYWVNWDILCTLSRLGLFFFLKAFQIKPGWGNEICVILNNMEVHKCNKITGK